MSKRTPQSVGGWEAPSGLRLSEKVASHIRELIITGELLPGAFIRTEPFAAELGVSNTPVREGLLQLRTEGFIELMARQGFRVATFTRDDIIDLFWAQAWLAGELTARAATRISEECLDHLEQSVADHRAAVRDGEDPEKIIKLGHDFHKTINLASGSRRLTLMLAGLARQLPNRFYNQIEGHLGDTVTSHPEILAALRDRAPERAAEIMRTHLLSGATPVIKALEELGVFQDGDAESGS